MSTQTANLTMQTGLQSQTTLSLLCTFKFVCHVPFKIIFGSLFELVEGNYPMLFSTVLFLLFLAPIFLSVVLFSFVPFSSLLSNFGCSSHVLLIIFIQNFKCMYKAGKTIDIGGIDRRLLYRSLDASRDILKIQDGGRKRAKSSSDLSNISK